MLKYFVYSFSAIIGVIFEKMTLRALRLILVVAAPPWNNFLVISKA
ncbi:hypothetical protein Cabys_869 [Caldithrix abyssi DSM 13497]|uniref:Uncharacterized protein n=1 Tax=Caldithrix abyssi DSM 13497 TaxID=880073 RepID=A0A1J1C5C2_CALAY|nr:hypothetical protein Cabys_869 [Caldithrix abyssi DSM 13497]